MNKKPDLMPLSSERRLEIEKYLAKIRTTGNPGCAWMIRDLLDAHDLLKERLRLAKSAIRQVEGLEPIKPTIDECLFHRCMKHLAVPRFNTSENGSECGACIGQERDEHAVNSRELELKLNEARRCLRSFADPTAHRSTAAHWAAQILGETK